MDLWLVFVFSIILLTNWSRDLKTDTRTTSIFFVFIIKELIVQSLQEFMMS